MDALVNKIIPFSAVDGPGNRTAVFLQGCNLDCKYCHNPETINICKVCGSCVKVCPAGALTMEENRIIYDSKQCVQCDSCIHVCPNISSPKTRIMTVEEVEKEIKRNIPFIRGITFSGGECTKQAAFLKELLKKLKETGLSILLDSNGTYDFEKDRELLDLIDGVMLDIKSYDKEEHIQITGHDNKKILENLVFLAEKDKLFEVRTVIVPELFDCRKSVEAVANVLQKYNQKKSIRYKLISYRPMGVREKYRSFRSPTQEEMESLASCLKSYGFADIVII